MRAPGDGSGSPWEWLDELREELGDLGSLHVLEDVRPFGSARPLPTTSHSVRVLPFRPRSSVPPSPCCTCKLYCEQRPDSGVLCRGLPAAFASGAS